MYKINSQNMQRRADALTPRNLASGTEIQSDEQRRANYVRAWKQIEEDLKKCDNKWHRQDLIAKKRELEEKIHAIRPKRKGLDIVKDHFIQVARERLQKPIYMLIMDEATKRAKDANLQSEQTPQPQPPSASPQDGETKKADSEKGKENNE